MKGLKVPERTEDFTADPVELFFDLAYVFAFSQLVGQLIAEPTWRGAGRAGLLFLLLWLAWSQLTWAANAVSGNGRPVRLIFLAATVVSVPMAAATSTALDGGGPVFAISLTIIMVLGFGIAALSADTEDLAAVRSAILWWNLPNLVAMALLIVGGFVGGSAQVWLWLAGLVIVIGAMVYAGRGEWVIRPAHMAERHGLILIIALGEVVVAIGIPVVAALEGGAGLPATTTVALAASGVFAGVLWWGYFDLVSPALERAAQNLGDVLDQGRFTRDVYTWGHAPIVGGVILAAAALEEITLHPGEPLYPSFRLMLFAGLAAMAGGVVGAVYRAYRAVAWERIIGVAAIGVVLVLGADLDGLVLLALVVVAMVATLITEHVRIDPTT